MDDCLSLCISIHPVEFASASAVLLLSNNRLWSLSRSRRTFIASGGLFFSKLKSFLSLRYFVEDNFVNKSQYEVGFATKLLK